MTLFLGHCLTILGLLNLTFIQQLVSLQQMPLLDVRERRALDQYTESSQRARTHNQNDLRATLMCRTICNSLVPNCSTTSTDMKLAPSKYKTNDTYCLIIFMRIVIILQRMFKNLHTCDFIADLNMCTTWNSIEVAIVVYKTQRET